MNDIIIQRDAVNPEALDSDLRAALGASVLGVSAGSYGLRVHLADNATPQQETQVKQIVQAHDPTKLTAGQQAGLDRAARLNQSRQEHGAAELDLAAFDKQSALIQKMAQKIVWLEREIVSLRGSNPA